jgi:5-methyltetrahydropteroyltriglutamate--homocysteine methyltransferase
VNTTQDPPAAANADVRATARAELVGSMIRPPEVIEAFTRVFPSRDDLGEHPRGRGTDTDRERLAAVTESAIADLVHRQVDAGVDVLVNGEFSRWTWWMSLYGALDGFAMDREPIVARDDRGGTRTQYVPRIDRPVRAVANPAADEARLLRRLTDHPFKVTLPAASRELTFWGRPVLGPEVYAAGIYQDPEEAFAELLAVERALLDEVVAAGSPYVQLDYPVYTHAADPSWCKVFRDGGVTREALLDRAISLDNDMIADVPSTVTTGLHFCRGNIGEKFLARGALDPVAERVFGSLAYDRLLIEWSEPERHGEFTALRYIRPETTVVLGIVNTKSHEVETEDELLRRVEDASRYLDVSRLAISPQCGFSSAVGINDATDIQWRKIEVMCRVADRVWGR